MHLLHTPHPCLVFSHLRTLAFICDLLCNGLTPEEWVFCVFTLSVLMHFTSLSTGRNLITIDAIFEFISRLLIPSSFVLHFPSILNEDGAVSREMQRPQKCEMNVVENPGRQRERERHNYWQCFLWDSSKLLIASKTRTQKRYKSPISRFRSNTVYFDKLKPKELGFHPDARRSSSPP